MVTSKIVIDGNKDSLVKDVIECVKESNQFKNVRAKKLDKNSLR